MQSLNDVISVESRQEFSRKCSYCEQIMEVTEGDVIYDARWYHKRCWEGAEQAQSHNRANSSDLVSLTHYT